MENPFGFMEPVAFSSGLTDHLGGIVHPGAGPGMAWKECWGTVITINKQKSQASG